MQFQPRIEPGSKILVTGVNGLVASHVADQALKAGYKVVGTVRDAGKAQWMKNRFDTEYGEGSFEIAVVPDMAAEGAFEASVKGVSGIAHVASIVGLLDPHQQIPGVIAGSLNVMKAAAKEPSVKAVVLTSSSWASATPVPNVKYHIDSNLWNEAAVKAAWAPPPYEQDRLMAVYAASKVEGEKACWKFMAENKPNFTFNAVLPAANFGRILDTTHQGYPSTMAWLKDLFIGQINIQPYIPPQYFVDTQDVARLHLAGLIDPSVKEERIFAYAQPYTWNQILGLFRKLYPERNFVDDIADQGTDLSTVANERSEEILRRVGKEGFTSLEQSVQWTVEGVL